MTDATAMASLGEIPLTGQRNDATTARAFTRRALQDARWPGPVDDVVLLVSEVVANVALHARTEGRLALFLRGSVLRAEIHDRSPVAPHRRSYGADATTGRGLQLVEVLTDASGFDVSSHGKAVWFEIDSVRRVPAAAVGHDLAEQHPPAADPGRLETPGLVTGLDAWGEDSTQARHRALVGV
ncbi:MAG TPA: ATP-binding protein [Acidimicrobiales bacterium]|nr:ATP-binding protein [Acidimicrobiales bacterium]